MLLGLTGGMATGKSTFAKMLTRLHHFDVFDADRHVHHLLREDQAVIQAIRQAFGEAVVLSEGGIDRSGLRRIVFRDPQARQLLESIIHPAVRAEWQQLAQASRLAHRDFLADIPLLFETGAETCFDATIVVTASPAVQKERWESRGLDSPVAQAMLASQWPLSEKESRASAVILNDGTLDELEHQARLLIESLFPSAS